MLSVNKKHYRNEKESMQLTEEITLPYVNKEQQKINQLNLVTLVIFNVFIVQISHEWYIEQIIKQSVDGKSITEIGIKLQLATLRPLHADWLVELYKKMTKSQVKEVDGRLAV